MYFSLKDYLKSVFIFCLDSVEDVYKLIFNILFHVYRNY